MRGQWISFVFLAVVIVNFTLSCQDEKRGHRRYGNCGNCGISPVGNTLIVNGEIVRPTNRFPWMVALNVNGMNICGGSIISEKFIMTAAHCFERSKGVSFTLDRNSSEFRNGRGETNYYNEDEVTISFLSKTKDRTPARKVAEIILHPHYHPETTGSVKNDIALIRMSNIIQCGKYAMPICLPSPAMRIEIGTIVGVAGWGQTKDPKDKGDKRLRATQIEVEHPNKCRIRGFNPGSSICLSGRGFSTICFGDSGGPAFIQKQNRFFGIGVASATMSKECDTRTTVIYTFVSDYVRWIKDVSGVDFRN